MKSRRKKKAPKEAATAVGVSEGMTEPKPERGRKGWSRVKKKVG